MTQQQPTFIGKYLDNEMMIEMALNNLRDARDQAKDGHAPNATNAIRRAIKSAEGALRHARRVTFAARVGQPIRRRKTT
ncbi:MAG: hypothetical protein AB7R89_33345 [Dehalococcoidia bacterium]